MGLLVADTAPRLRLTRPVLLETMLRPSEVPTPVVQVELLFEHLVIQAQAQDEIRADLTPADVASALTGALPPFPAGLQQAASSQTSWVRKSRQF